MKILFVCLLLATGAMRLAELAVSVRRIRERPADLVDEPALFPAMAGLHVALVALPILEVFLLDRPFLPAVGIPALATLALATALRVWTLRTIGYAWNVRVLAPPVIATTGPYAYIRHPNYLVVILELAALPLVHTAWMSAVILTLWNAAVLARRIRTEEATLGRDPAWQDAFRAKARFIPGVF
jgi:methyltransferase